MRNAANGQLTEVAVCVRGSLGTAAAGPLRTGYSAAGPGHSAPPACVFKRAQRRIHVGMHRALVHPYHVWPCLKYTRRAEQRCGALFTRAVLGAKALRTLSNAAGSWQHFLFSTCCHRCLTEGSLNKNGGGGRGGEGSVVHRRPSGFQHFLSRYHSNIVKLRVISHSFSMGRPQFSAPSFVRPPVPPPHPAVPEQRPSGTAGPPGREAEALPLPARGSAGHRGQSAVRGTEPPADPRGRQQCVGFAEEGPGHPQRCALCSDCDGKSMGFIWEG